MASVSQLQQPELQAIWVQLSLREVGTNSFTIPQIVGVHWYGRVCTDDKITRSEIQALYSAALTNRSFGAAAAESFRGLGQDA